MREFCAGRFGRGELRALVEPGGIDRGRWRELADLGVFGLRVPEGAGGVGLGSPDAVLVFEELGRALVPGPLVATHLAAELLPGALTGDEVVGLLDPADEPLLAEHLPALDAVLVLREDGVRRVDPAALTAAPVERPVDPLTPLHQVAKLPAGEPLAGAEVAARWWTCGQTLTAALSLGIAEAVLDLAVAYARTREQFDRPIGSFQAVKHLLADMLVRLEIARAAVYSAGVVLDDPDAGDARRAAAAAKLLADEAAVGNARSCVQAHGGMGFTWDVDVHLFLKRAWVHETTFGDSARNAELLAELV